MPHESSASRSGLIHGGIVLLALLASAAFAIAEADGNRPAWVVWLSVVGQAAVTAGAAVWFRRLKTRSPETIALSPLLLAVMGGSYLWEPFSRWAFGSGRPFETQVMLGLNNVMLAMAAVSCWRRYSVWTLVASLFVVMFSAAMTTSLAVRLLVVAYALGAVVWLVCSYWEGLRNRLSAANERTSPSWIWIACGVLLAVGLLTTARFGGNQALSAFQGWLPGSGGSGEFDPFARNGVGDGEALVAGTDNITSFAPIDDAPFLQDDQPSLYDVFDDTYDEPQPPKDQDRTIGLPPELASRIKEHLHARTQKASREFSTLRRSTESRTKVEDIRSDALLYVAGRTPLHLRLEVFDLFDGITWYAEPDVEHPPPLRMVEREGRSWVDASQFPRAYECFRGPLSHALKVVNLDTNRIPAPLHLTGIHIADVDRADLFGWVQKDVVRMERDRLPALVPIHLTSAVLDRSELHDSPLLGAGRQVYRGPAYCSQISSADMTRIAELAASWVADVPVGWPQVLEIERRLREEYVHDHGAIVDSDETLPVARFLLEDRRGPDYQFATAAAVMLRSLGHSTRVVSGFYADPAKYDRRSRHTPVHKDDVHFWVEVYLGASTWATVEPTPGYSILEPPPGLWEHAWSVVEHIGRWLTANAWPVALAIAAATLLFWRRLDVLDAWYTLRWRCVSAAETRRQVVATWRLVDWRLTVFGRPRPAGQTPHAWLTSGGAADPQFQEPLHELIRLVEWATFAPASTPPASDSDVAALCRSIVRDVTRHTIRRSQSPEALRASLSHRLLLRFSRLFSLPTRTQLTNG